MLSRLLEKHDAGILLPSFRRYRRYIALTFGFSLVAAVFEGFSIGMLVPFLQSFSETAEPFRTGVGWVDTHLLGVDASRIGRMYRVCGLILIATWIRAVAGYFSSVYMVTSRARIIQDIRERAVNQLTRVSMAYYATARGGEIMNSVTNEAGRTSAALTVSFTYVMKGMMLVMYAALMIWISWQLSLIALTVFLLLSIGLTHLMKSIKSRGEEITRANAAFYSAIKEFLEGVRTVIAYNMQDPERQNLHRAARRSADAAIETTKRSRLIQPISQAVVSSVLVVLVLVAVQYFVMPGIINIAFLLTFLFALFRVMPIVHQLNNERGTWAENRAGLTNVATLLRNDDKPYLPEGIRTANPLQSAIQFENVWFAYETGKPVLRDINLSIEQGKTTAFVGASGAGKSTLVDLIPRFHDPTEGRILYDGTDLRDFRKKPLRDQIAIVSQSTHIFNDTASANIAYGTEGVTEREVRRAAEMANAADFIEELSEGFDTVLGERGVRLSGGQRQRIAIARALLQDPDILILDEATSDLDSISERLVQESLERLMEGRTVIAIAHRLSTIENADWVVVLEEGEIVEQGPYDELLSRRGQLWEYHSVQFQLA
jgi:subfamily B ATP-binding cassette protein MsbA